MEQARVLLLHAFLLVLLCFLSLGSSDEVYESVDTEPPFVLEEYIYFEITDPHSLAYSYRARLARNFGTSFERPLRGAELMLGEPYEGCSQLTNDVANAVVMLIRGGCSFLTKALNAQKAKALAVLIADHNEHNDEHLVDMVDDKTNRKVAIPAIFVMGKDGAMIRRELEEMGLMSAVINIPVNMTGVPITKVHQPPWTLW